MPKSDAGNPKTKLFEAAKRAGVTKKHLRAAMQRLLERDEIHLEMYTKPSRGSLRIVAGAQPPQRSEPKPGPTPDALRMRWVRVRRRVAKLQLGEQSCDRMASPRP